MVSRLLRDIPTALVASGWLDQPLLMSQTTPHISIRSEVASLTVALLCREPRDLFRISPSLDSFASRELGRFRPRQNKSFD